MPDPALFREIEFVMQNVYEPDIRLYLEETYKCFKAKAFNGTVVMAWSATVSHLMYEVKTIGLEVFQYGYRKIFPDRKKVLNALEDLVNEDARAFISVCEQMRFLVVRAEDLQRFRDRRNYSAHPSNRPINAIDVEKFLKICLRVVNRAPRDAKILDSVFLVECVLSDISVAAMVVDQIHPDHLERAGEKLIEAYFNNSESKYDEIVDIWYRLWDLLPKACKDVLWRKLAIEAIRILKEKNEHRNEDDLARFIIWPLSNQKHLYRDFIARQYVCWLKHKVKAGLFDSEDKKFSLWLYDKLPERFRRQIVDLCARWLVRRVKRGDFTGEDLDFNAWLKEQSNSNKLTRFQIITNIIVRRYQ